MHYHALFLLIAQALAAPGLGKDILDVTALVPVLVTKHRTVDHAGVYTFQRAEVVTAKGPTVLAWTGAECKTTTYPWGNPPPPPPACYPSTTTVTDALLTITVPGWGHKTVTKTKTVIEHRKKTITEPGTTVTKIHKHTVTEPASTVTKIHKHTVTESCSTTSILPAPSGACQNVDLTCLPQGWTIDYYANPFIGYSFPQSGLGPGYYISENLTPLASAISGVSYFPQDTGADQSQYPYIYPNSSYPEDYYAVGYTRDIEGITVDGNNFTLVYHALYRAPLSGNYTFCTSADNENAVFFGAGKGAAFSCDGGKPLPDSPPSQTGTLATGGNYMNPASCFNEILEIGEFYPIRFVMGDYQGPSALGFTIQPPGGTASYNNTNYLYAAKCAYHHHHHHH